MKIKTIFLTLLLLIISTSTVLAVASDEADESTTGNSNAETIKMRAQERAQEVQEKREAAAKERKAAIEERQQAASEKSEEMKADRAEKTEEVCNRITTRINGRIASYEENQDKWSSRYNGVHKRVTSLADKLEDKGCEVDQVTTDLETFDAYIKDFAASFRVFQSSFQGTRAYVCGESEGEFVGQFREAQSELQNVKGSAARLQNFVNSTLKPHLQQAGQACNTQLSNSGGE